MGYVGEVDSAILKRSNNFYQLGDYVGRSGLEQYYEKQLMGQRGIEFWIKDNKNRLVGHYQDKNLDTPAVAGKNLRTYMDIELQQLAERLLAGKDRRRRCDRTFHRRVSWPWPRGRATTPNSLTLVLTNNPTTEGWPSTRPAPCSTGPSKAYTLPGPPTSPWVRLSALTKE